MSVLIIGAGGHGREVADIVLACGLEIAGFVDDEPGDLAPVARLGLRVLGTLAELDRHAGTAVLGIGDGRTRCNVAEEHADVLWLSAQVHPLASLGTAVAVGDGTVLAAGARLTTGIQVGAHVYVGPNATVGHDSVLEEGATILPGATVSGRVLVGRGATIGTGANIRQGVAIGCGAIVGAGAVVLDDVDADATVVGVPARPLPTSF